MIKGRRFANGMMKGMTLVLLRILLSFIVLLLMSRSKNDIALYIFILTAFISFFDGFIAKRKKKRSQLRSIVDPFADKLLVNLTAVALYYKEMLPFWVMVVFLVKDASIILGAMVILFKNTKTIFRSNAIDKVAVFIQILTLISVLMGRLDYVLLWLSVVLVAFSLFVTLFRSGVMSVTYKTDLEEIRFTRLLKLPDLFTFGNMLMGLLAILFSISNRHNAAVVALILAVFFDYLDGKVARMVKREGEFGKQLDSLADTISFGVAPAIFGFSLIQTNFAMVIFAVFLFAGVLRLARYNIMEFTGGFAGMPITVNGFMIPLIYLLKVPVSVYPYVYLFLAIMMVSPLKVKKLF